MLNYVIPTTVVDNFFDDPKWVRDFALQQEFKTDPENSWPGARTTLVGDLDRDFFHHTISRFMALFYDFRYHDLQWEAKGFFQRVDKNYEYGWVHRDPALITGIVYLDDEPSTSAGTTIYQPKKPGATEIHLAERTESFRNPEITSSLANFRKENNEQFEESIVVKNKFNRLVGFDSHLYHAANDYVGDGNSSRLTLVFFVGGVFPYKYPLQRTKSR